MAKLYVTATPIGNLEDITLRALRVLREVDFILCEDTRVTRKLLDKYEIKAGLISYHQHSKLKKADKIAELLKNGKNLALVTDAGTPAISDPGGKLVEYLIENGIEVDILAVPGPSAVTAALSISGFSADRFLFMGFPPHKKGRQKFFKKIIKSVCTVVFYESSHRILKAFEELRELDRRIVVCREITKVFESVYRGKTDEVAGKFNTQNTRGEFVVVIEKKKRNKIEPVVKS